MMNNFHFQCKISTKNYNRVFVQSLTFLWHFLIFNVMAEFRNLYGYDVLLNLYRDRDIFVMKLVKKHQELVVFHYSLNAVEYNNNNETEIALNITSM